MNRPVKLCRWCGAPFTAKSKERSAAFDRRKHCSRSCQVSTQNRVRAAEKATIQAGAAGANGGGK